MTNKVESFNRFSQWIGFGNRGVIADNGLCGQPIRYEAVYTDSTRAGLCVTHTAHVRACAVCGGPKLATIRTSDTVTPAGQPPQQQ